MKIYPISDSILQLTRSERGVLTCKLLLDFLNSNAVQYLDDSNSLASASLACWFLIGGPNNAAEVKKQLEEVIERNPWVK